MCSYFTTLRLHQPHRYYIGAKFKIVLLKRTIKTAKIINVKSFTINKINDFISYLDTGMTAGDLMMMLQTMYKNYHVDWDTQLLDFILFGTLTKDT
jgi:hypothetical protein